MAAAVPRRPSRRRGGRYQPARCNRCHGSIKWLRLRGKYWKFDPKPIDPRTHSGPLAYPVEGKTAWPLGRLVEELMGRREITESEAREEAYDYPWHCVHACVKEPDQ